MTILYNSIIINAPIEKIWDALANIERLALYDPTVKSLEVLTSHKSGLDARRKVTMLDGKSWFEEKVAAWKPREALTYELTSCSFPVTRLKHNYSFENIDGKIKVMQKMEYQVKFGLFGKALDALMIKKQSDIGIKKFMDGLKSYAEKS